MSQERRLYGGTASYSNLYSNSLNDGGAVDERVVIADNAAFSFGDGLGNDTPYSISCWVKKTAGTSGALMAKADFEWQFFIFGSQLFCRIFSQNTNTNFIGRRTTTTIGNGTWTLCVFTYGAGKTASSCKLYINTTLSDTNDSTSGVYVGVSNTAANVFFGVANGAATLPYNGLIAHPAMFNKELSAAEVTELHTKKMGDYRTLSFAANLVSAYSFPNGQANFPTCTDYVNARNGTMTNQENTDITADVPV